ncbi:glycosyltransferase family 2 protein [Flavobacterium acetivorans]|uniref:glycosyltransferase family 2 protein n=1 Tax=Flavobacterium acetivorans TaxID=2893883 RepID=UPI001E42FD0C|nr:glycosyltransferase family A protein [Flavobacterium sp. F-29]UFH35716.1 glycosyltransferase family 2 protein [Flavobacterium sp. F-29]
MEALESILNQTVKADEIIIVDDGSGEETIKILKTISSPNVQIIYQENKGVSSARNRAISLAKTDYILNLDADDSFEPTFIEKAVQVLNENENIGVVGCWYKVFGNKERNNNIIKPLGGNVRNFLVKNNALGTSMFRRKCWEVISGFDENMLYGYEDWDFWISILKDNWEMYIINEVLFNYRIKNTSRDQTAEKIHDYEIKKYIFLKHKELYFNSFEGYALQLLENNSALNQKNKQLKKSFTYKIGTLMMNPLRIFNVIINRFIR